MLQDTRAMTLQQDLYVFGRDCSQKDTGMNLQMPSMYELVQHDVYTPEEVARLLGMDVNVVCTAAFAGDPWARIVGRDITSIRREDGIAWFMREGGHR